MNKKEPHLIASERYDKALNETYFLRNLYIHNKITIASLGYFKESEADEIVKYSKHIKKWIKHRRKQGEQSIYDNEI